MTQEDEQYCLKALSEGNIHAFELLFLEWHPRLVEFLSRMLSGEKSSEDLAYDFAQDVFFDVWVFRNKFSQVKSFRSYLFQMAKYKVYNHFDRKDVEMKFEKELSDPEFELDSSGESALVASEVEILIRRTLDGMPKKRRNVFVMSRFQGYSNDRIASELNIDKRTVENHITNVLAALRKVIKSIVVLCVSLMLPY